MSAKDKVVTEPSTSTWELGDAALKDQLTSRKRPRESGSSPPPQTTKKARTYGEKELESLMIDVCLERIERRQIEQGRAQLNQTGRDIITGELKSIFCQLKRVDTEGYTTHIHHLNSTCAGHRENEKIEKAVLNFFDRNGLLRLHAQLQGNGRWHMILRGLGLPLTDLRNLDANLRFQTNDIERQLKSEIADILTWLTQGKVSRNHTVNTNMRLDETLEDGRAGHQLCISQPPVSIVQYVLSDAHIKEIFALVSSTSNAVISPKPDQKRPEPSRVIERQHSVEPTAPIKQDSDDTQQGSNQDAAMALARSLPQQKADAYHDEELKRTVATCSKIQTYGQAYNIVIEQLKSAQNGGPTPTFVSDLQMPDAEACYYRLESLWNRALQAINHRGVEHLRTNIDLFYTFAICMREAHCLLRVLHYYGCDVSQLVGTGWDLDGMRRLQSELVDFAHEEPFIWSKPDVDAICTALQAAHNQHALLTGSHPSRFGVVESCEPEASDPVLQPIYHPVDYQAPTEMEVDQAPQTCSFFLNKGGCTKVGDARRPCNFDHPENLRYNTACPNLENSQCRFGDLGCRYRHDIVNTPTPIGASPSGKKRDPGLGSSYCRGHQQGNCRKGDRCTWLHDTPPPGLLYQNVAPSNFTTDNPFQNGGLQKTPCQFLAKGSCKYSDTQCKYSHDPAVFANHKIIPQPLGDATMGGAASNGDNTHQRPRSEMPCRNENNGRHCTKLSCWFAHMNPQSAAYTDANGYAAGDEMEPQNSRRGRGGRAQKDFTYRPHQPVAFSQLPQMQTADDARARLQQFLLNNAARTNNQGRGNNRGNHRGQNSGIQSNGPQNQGNMHNIRSNRRGGRSNQTSNHTHGGNQVERPVNLSGAYAQSTGSGGL